MYVCPSTGKVCGATQTKVRSVADHRRFYAVINAAFTHWPDGHEFKPDDAEHLRKWLLCKAGYRDSTLVNVDFADDQPALMKLISLVVEAAVLAADGHAFIRPHGAAVAVFKAKSIKFDTLPQTQFGLLRDKVESVIESELNITADKLLQETDGAA